MKKVDKIINNNGHHIFAHKFEEGSLLCDSYITDKDGTTRVDWNEKTFSIYNYPQDENKRKKIEKLIVKLKSIKL